MNPLRPLFPVLVLLVACRGSSPSPATGASVGSVWSPEAASAEGGSEAATASLPLQLVADVPLPGLSVRFDYQDLDPAKGHLVIAHMDDASVVIVNTSDGSLVKILPGI